MGRLSSAYAGVLRSLPNSRRLNRVSWGAEALFGDRVLVLADPLGRYWGDGHTVACHACTERLRNGSTTPEQIEDFLVELERVGLLFRYTVDGERYLQVFEYFVGTKKDPKDPNAPATPVRARFPEPPSVPPRPPVDDADASNAPPSAAPAPLCTDLHRPVQSGTEVHPDRMIGDRGSDDRNDRGSERSGDRGSRPLGGRRARARPVFDPKVYVLETYPDLAARILPGVEERLAHGRESSKGKWKEHQWKQHLEDAAKDPERWCDAVRVSRKQDWKGVNVDWLPSRSGRGRVRDGSRDAIGDEIAEILSPEVRNGRP